MYNSLKSPVLDSLYVINIIIIVIVIFCYYQYNDKIWSYGFKFQNWKISILELREKKLFLQSGKW